MNTYQQDLIKEVLRLEIERPESVFLPSDFSFDVVDNMIMLRCKALAESLLILSPSKSNLNLAYKAILQPGFLYDMEKHQPMSIRELYLLIWEWMRQIAKILASPIDVKRDNNQLEPTSPKQLVSRMKHTLSLN